MAYDAGLAEVFRDALSAETVTEKNMFGGLCFMLGGNMVCGIFRQRPMFRVGPANTTAALAQPGVGQMEMKGKPMVGYVDCSAELFADDRARDRLLNLAVGFVKTLKPK